LATEFHFSKSVARFWQQISIFQKLLPGFGNRFQFFEKLLPDTMPGCVPNTQGNNPEFIVSKPESDKWNDCVF
jgi:hypothetical protein